jgi:hypothetical protein
MKQQDQALADQPSKPGTQPQAVETKGSMYTEPVAGTQPQVVYMTRPLVPQKETMTPEVQQKHEDSKRHYPKLNLSEGEYVISAVKRTPIGLMSIWVISAIVIIAIFVITGFLAANARSSASTIGGTATTPLLLVIPALLISLLIFLFAFVATTVYNANKFFLTNESIIQHIQTSLFNLREQTISLESIEDVSYSQDGIMPHMFNYGSIRLSTVGDEDTYRFHYTSDPQNQIAILNNAVEAFKNGRRVEG